MYFYFYLLLSPFRIQHKPWCSFTPPALLQIAITLLLIFSFCSFIQAQALQKQWDKTFGGNNSEDLNYSIQTSDGGYLLAGVSDSDISGDKSEANRGESYDYWVVKVSSTGTKEWDKTFGGSNYDQLNFAIQTSDRGYLLVGGSVSGISGEKSEANRGGLDYWIVKISARGTKEWDKSFGGNEHDFIYFALQTSDGGYLLAGYSASDIGGDKSEASRGEYDYWIIKISANGIKEWDKTFGGNGNDYIITVIQTSDGEYLLTGISNSGFGGDKSEANRGEGNDYWVVKVSSTGTKEWDKTFGGSNFEHLNSTIQTSDGGYLLAGASASGISGDKSEANRGEYDYWIIKISANGIREWDKTFGGSNYEILVAANPTKDGGYLLAGESLSGISGDKSEASRGDQDYWMIKVSSTGTKEWDKTIGGGELERLTTTFLTKDGGYLLAGVSNSGLGGDKSEANRGEYDYWVVKVSSTGTKEWDKTLGGSSDDNYFTTAFQTSDRGYLLAGISSSNISGEKSEDSRGAHDYWIVKLIETENTFINSFTLINAETQHDILTLKDGAFISLNTVAKVLMNIRVNTTAEITAIKFELSGPITHTQIDTTQPYVLFVDNVQGHYFKTGEYSLTATAFTINGIGTAITLTFHVVEALSENIKVNFQDKHTKTPEGWLKDYGLPFGEKQIGDSSLFFGWLNKADNSPIDLSVGGTFPGNGRRRPVPSDVLLATLMHMQGKHVINFRGNSTESYWELAVDNGEYQVSVSVGDGYRYTAMDPEYHSINVESIPAISQFLPQGPSGSLTRFKQASVNVTVSDGYLTIDADGGTNTKINYAIIQPLITSSSITARKAIIFEPLTTQSQVSAYPNPFSNKLTIKAFVNGKVSVSLYDLMGNSYYQATHPLMTGELQVDLSAVNLPAGIYLLKLQAEDGTSQLLKVVKK